MPLQEEDEDDNSSATEAAQVDRGLRGLTHEILRERAPYENEDPRDPLWLRWLKFFSILLVLPLLCGLGFGYAGIGFSLGGAIGFVLALTYVVRCLAKGIDP